jgi:hypothetical protein
MRTWSEGDCEIKAIIRHTSFVAREGCLRTAPQAKSNKTGNPHFGAIKREIKG